MNVIVTKTGTNAATIQWEQERHYSDGDSIATFSESFNRATWKGHNRPHRALYAGHFDEPWSDRDPVEVVIGATAAGLEMFEVATDKSVGRVGNAGKVWLRGLSWDTQDDNPIEPVEHEPAQNDKVTEHGHGSDRSPGPDVLVASSKGLPGKAPGDVKSPSRSRNGKLHDCLCGCGTQVHGMYAQGHDARHVSKVVAAASGLDHDVNFTEWIAQELPTEALRVKAARAIAKLVK